MGGSPTNVHSMRAIGQLAQDAGLRVMEASGWVDRGRTWGTLNPEYVVAHHTAAPFDADRVLIDGRSDLPGPLCNFSLHADGTVVLIASGLANHCGVATISSTQAYGIEATGPIPLSASAVTAFPQYQEYVILCAAIRLHHGWPANRVLGHKEVALPDGRKPDPGFGSRAPAPYPDMTAFRAAVDQRVRTWGVGEEELTVTEAQDILAAIAKVREDLTVFGTTGLERTAEDFAARQRETLAALERLEAGRTPFQQALAARVDALEELLTPKEPIT